MLITPIKTNNSSGILRYYDLATLHGIPPKIIWFRVGNTLTKNLAEIIKNRKDIIAAFLKDPIYSDIACLEIGPKRTSHNIGSSTIGRMTMAIQHFGILLNSRILALINTLYSGQSGRRNFSPNCEYP